VRGGTVESRLRSHLLEGSFWPVTVTFPCTPLYIQVKIVKRTVACQKRIPVNNSLLK